MVVVNKVCTITTCNPQSCGLGWWNQSRSHKIEGFLGCTWLACATDAWTKSTCSTFHEDLHPNTAQGLAVDRASLQQHSEEACNSIDLGRMSKENMPNEVMVNILTHLTEPVMPHYQSLDGKAASYFLRLWEFRTPTYEIEGELYGEQKCDVLKALTL